MEKSRLLDEYEFTQERLGIMGNIIKKIKSESVIYLKEQNSTQQKKLFIIIIKQILEIIENSVKANNMLLSLKFCFPKTYEESFLKFGEFYKIDKKLIDELISFVTFRKKMKQRFSDLKPEEFIKKVESILSLYLKYMKKVQMIMC